MTGNTQFTTEFYQKSRGCKGYTLEKRKGEESMKSIDVFCHLMPQKYAELAMNESPNKSHMFVRALKMQAMSDMEYRKQVMEGFEGYKQIPNIVSPPVELFAGPDKSPKLAAIGNDETKRSQTAIGPLLWIYRGYPRLTMCLRLWKRSNDARIWGQRESRSTHI